jgi:hypothetical protein
VVALLRARQCNAVTFHDLRSCVDGVRLMLDATRADWDGVQTAGDEGAGAAHGYAPVVRHLQEIVAAESGLPINPAELRDGCARVWGKINDVLPDLAAAAADVPTVPPPVPVYPPTSVKNKNKGSAASSEKNEEKLEEKGFAKFFSVNENRFRGKVDSRRPDVAEAYKGVKDAADAVIRAFQESFGEECEPDFKFNDNKVRSVRLNYRLEA